MHDDDDWSALARRVEEHLQRLGRCSAHTRQATLSYARCIREWRAAHPDADLATAVREAAEAKAATCRRAWAQVVRRLYAAANLVWHDLLGELAQPLTPPPGLLASARHQRRAATEDAGGTRVFSAAEVAQLLDAAAKMAAQQPLAHPLTLLLFTTGLRIGAAAAIRWHQVLQPTRDGVGRTAVVREKGGSRRVLLLTDHVRRALWDRWLAAGGGDADARVFPRSVRQLRNIFYAVCDAAGQAGRHCHPHNARPGGRRGPPRRPRDGPAHGGARAVRPRQLGGADRQVPGAPQRAHDGRVLPAAQLRRGGRADAHAGLVGHPISRHAPR